MQQSIFTTLVGQVTAALSATLDLKQRNLLLSSENEALEEIRREFDAIIDTYLDEKSDLLTLTLMLCCLEQPTLFTREPVFFPSCLSESGSPRQMNAQHSVYHNLYDLLRKALEEEFSAWYQEHQKDEEIGEDEDESM